MDLFGDSLLGDLMDVPATTDVASDDVDLFADAAFVSAAPRAESSGIHKQQVNLELFTWIKSTIKIFHFFICRIPLTSSQTSPRFQLLPHQALTSSQTRLQLLQLLPHQALASSQIRPHLPQFLPHQVLTSSQTRPWLLHLLPHQALAPSRR